jgi:hypothetical protein
MQHRAQKVCVKGVEWKVSRERREERGERWEKGEGRREKGEGRRERVENCRTAEAGQNLVEQSLARFSDPSEFFWKVQA